MKIFKSIFRNKKTVAKNKKITIDKSIANNINVENNNFDNNININENTFANKNKDTILNDFKIYLANYNKLSDTTKSTYFNSLKQALSNQEFSSVNDTDFDELNSYLIEKSRRKNDVSKVKNALKLLYKSNAVIGNSELNKIEKIRQYKPKGHKYPQEDLQLKKINLKINAIKNKKLKLAYRLMEVSGLRISEIARLKKNAISFDKDGRICITVINGKGSKNRKFKTFKKDTYLYNELKSLVNNTENNNTIFYTASYMRKIALKLGFKSHDLRKVFSQLVYYNYDGNKKETIELVQKLLGHNLNSKTYLVYLNRKINFTGTKYDI